MKTHPAPDRRQARVVVLQLLFQDDLNPRNNPAKGEEMIRNSLRQPDLVRFAEDLLAGVRRNRRDLDERLQTVTENWALDRMAAVDRNVLRLGAYELLHTDTPPSVVIDEAVELAKSFGTENSGAFVNGILDSLLRQEKAASAGSAGRRGERDASS